MINRATMLYIIFCQRCLCWWCCNILFVVMPMILFGYINWIKLDFVQCCWCHPCGSTVCIWRNLLFFVEGSFPAGYVEYSFEIRWAKNMVRRLRCVYHVLFQQFQIWKVSWFLVVSDLGELMVGGSRRDHRATTGFPTDSNGIAKHFFRDLKLYTVGWSARSRKCEHVIHQERTICWFKGLNEKGLW